jgi:hypothetical protein
MGNSPWFKLHFSDDTARKMSREKYREARRWLRRAQHILRLRYESAYIDPKNPQAVIIPATDDILPKNFK